MNENQIKELFLDISDEWRILLLNENIRKILIDCINNHKGNIDNIFLPFKLTQLDCIKGIIECDNIPQNEKYNLSKMGYIVFNNIPSWIKFYKAIIEILQKNYSLQIININYIDMTMFPKDLNLYTNKYDNAYLFTDGAATANGKINCKASSAWLFYDNKRFIYNNLLVPSVSIAGKKYGTSNIRGELTAILHGLQNMPKLYDNQRFKIVTDSLLSINCIEVWVKSWLKDKSKLEEKKNIDLIVPIFEIIQTIRKKHNVEFIHVKSHQKVPPSREKDPYEWFLYTGNDIVDKLCTSFLRK